MTKMFRKNLVRVVASLALMLLPLSVPAVAHAQTDSIQNGVGCGTQFQFSCTSAISNGAYNSASTSSVQNLLTTAVNIFSIVVGIIAVIMIVVGGFKYITSGGESSKVSGAQSTILYALVGLVIVVLAQVIVHFVLNRANSAASGSIYLVKSIL
jgi:hypothetical protein